MSLIDQTLTRLKSEGKKALIPYVTAGDPHPDHTVGIMHALVEAGADIIELGVPFSDPMADGPVIQLACERALTHSTSLNEVLEMVAQFRQTNRHTPVVLMGYLNPVEVMGYEVFADKAHKAGVNGVLIVDMPPEEGADTVALLRSKKLDCIFLIAPTTTEDRVEAICQQSSGYVYYVSVKGVTGSASLDADEVAEKVASIKQKTALPVGVGFGIRNVETACAVARVSDGIIIGSSLVNIIAANVARPEQIPEQLQAFLGPIRKAMDSL
ncbi:MAG: tryptophan synthase subunit alpha [Gammaproteobacteria bacterium]|nr:MAG: tryptophan synthase subunit alpha [Pseudomonadota bacterium]PIE38028.1 MAG: tryptophan synthase subunit alpha [Gammaproteobacteria bacterium]